MSVFVGCKVTMTQTLLATNLMMQSILKDLNVTLPAVKCTH